MTLEITDEYKQAIDSMLNNQLTCVLGQAGTGKSQLLNYMLQYIRQHNNSLNIGEAHLYTKEEYIESYGDKDLGAITNKFRQSYVVLGNVAPTGIAALNIKGNTIHSRFMIAPKSVYHYSLLRNNEKIKLLPNVQETIFNSWIEPNNIKIKEIYVKNLILFIDEISMIRADLFDLMDYKLRNTYISNLPFGGVKIVMFGDFAQLPPITTDETKDRFKELNKYYATNYKNGNLIESETFKLFNIIKLTKIFRQDESQNQFKEILNQIRVGKQTKIDLQKLNENYNKDIGETAIFLSTTNAKANTINKDFYTLNKNTAHIIEPNKSSKWIDTVDINVSTLFLKKDLQVMILANNAAKNYYNGDIGIIKDFNITDKYISSIIIELFRKDDSGNSIRISLDLYRWLYHPTEGFLYPQDLVPEIDLVPGDDLYYVFNTTKSIDTLPERLQQWYSKVINVNNKYFPTKESFNRTLNNINQKLEEGLASFTQFPIKQSNAITIHKSQGQSFDKAYLDLGDNSFCHGQTYVALSRCRSLEGLSLINKVNDRHIIIDNDLINYL